jgi:hypothetical protein
MLGNVVSALRIHISGECKSLLDQLGGFTIDNRGLVAMKVGENV